jgi:hypothetical protein
MRWTYDVLHRPSALYEQPAAGEPERVSERYAYADSGGTEAAATARGARARGAQGASKTPSLATSAKNDATRKLSTLSIGGAGTAPANDNFYDPNLADRLKNYRAANEGRFAAMAEKEFHHQILDDSNP